MILLGFVGESAADFRTGSRLVDRVLVDQIDWVTEEVLQDYRAWGGAEAGEQMLHWRTVDRLATQRKVRAHGHFGGAPGLPDARAARKALLLFAGLSARPEAVLLVRDTDGDQTRKQGLAQARDTVTWPFRVVIGAAHTKRECWVLAGFQAQDEDEEVLLANEREALGFDPCTCAHALTARHDADKRSAKRVVSALTGGDAVREDSCLEVELDLLRERGGGTGLADFLGEVVDRVVPLLR